MGTEGGANGNSQSMHGVGGRVVTETNRETTKADKQGYKPMRKQETEKLLETDHIW